MPINQDNYMKYKSLLFDEKFNENTQAIKLSILEKASPILEDFNKYLIDNIENVFEFVKKLEDSKKQDVKDALSGALISGIDLFISVILANTITIDFSKFEEGSPLDTEKLNNNLQNDENKTEIITKYDIFPLVQEVADIYFYNLVEKSPEIVEYKFGEIENFKNYFGYIIESAYVICYSLFI